MTEPDVLFLECETKDGDLGMTSFSFSLAALLNDYAGWLQRNGRTHADVAYAKICRCSDYACIATLACEDGLVVLQPRRAYGGPFARLIRTALRELKLRWRVLKCVFEGRHIHFSEEHVQDDEPPEEDDEE